MIDRISSSEKLGNIWHPGPMPRGRTIIVPTPVGTWRAMSLLFHLKMIVSGGMVEADLKGQVETTVLAPPEAVYDLVSDVTRMGSWSPECYRCEWLDGATGPAVGARFRGHNRRGWFRWHTTCTVTEAERGRVFAFEADPWGRVQTRWRYQFDGTEGGTSLRESFEVLWYARVIIRFLGGPRRRLAQLQESARQTLERVKAAVEAA